MCLCIFSPANMKRFRMEILQLKICKGSLTSVICPIRETVHYGNWLWWCQPELIGVPDRVRRSLTWGSSTRPKLLTHCVIWHVWLVYFVPVARHAVGTGKLEFHSTCRLSSVLFVFLCCFLPPSLFSAWHQIIRSVRFYWSFFVVNLLLIQPCFCLTPLFLQQKRIRLLIYVLFYVTHDSMCSSHVDNQGFH